MQNLTTQHFGFLIVTGQSHKDNRNKLYSRCVCVCGRELIVRNDALKRGQKGCASCVQKTHGMTHTRSHRCWARMNSRCHDKNMPQYKYYGGRGITVCDRWRHSFETFLSDMGEMPRGLELDRINNDGNYEPSNCRWTDRSNQMKNTRSSRHITYRGVTKNLCDWSKEIRIHRRTIANRLKLGWTVSEAMETPPQKTYLHQTRPLVTKKSK